MRVLSLILLSLLLAACSSNDEKDEESKVAKLIDFERTAKHEKLWSSKVGSGKGRKYLPFVPAIHGDVIYAADPSGSVSAFELKSGKKIWKVKTDYRISGAVGASARVVSFGTLDGEVVGLSSENGEELWKSDVSSEVVARPAVNSSVVVAQTIDARVFAFNAKSGEQLWSYDHLSPVLTLRGTSAPVMTTTQVICAFDNGQIVGFSLSDGSRVWESRVSQPKGKTDLERIVDVDGTPHIEGGLIYAGGYQGNIAAFGRAQGNPIWKKSLSTYQNLTVSGGRVFVSTDRSRVLALNASNGDVIWQNENMLNRNVGAPAVIGEYVVVIDEDDHMHVMARDDGAFAHRFKPKGSGFHSAMLSHLGKLYILSDDGTLSSYEIKSR